MKLRFYHAPLAAALFVCALVLVPSQAPVARAQENRNPAPATDGGTRPAQTTPAPTPTRIPQKQLSPLERRAAAFAKMLEGQRYYTSARSGSMTVEALRLAQRSFEEAAELDPTLSEARTALAEIAFFFLNDTEMAEREALAATRSNANNFGSHRILSRIYTLKSKLFEDALDRASADKAVAELREIVRLEPDDAEAWALLGEFYLATKRENEAIEAFRRWLAAPPPSDARFFQVLTKGRELTSEDAAARLGEVLLKLGRTQEAIAAIRRAVMLAPDNSRNFELLRRAYDAEGGKDPRLLEELRQFVATNPSNVSAISLLARTEARAGRVDDAVATLRSAIEKRQKGDREQLSLQAELAQVFSDAMRYDEAVTIYEDLLKSRGIGNAALTSSGDKRFASLVMSRIIALQRQAGKGSDALASVERMRRLLGSDDPAADMQYIFLLRQQNKKNEALEAARAARLKFPAQEEFLRLEASILASLGRPDEGAALLRARLKGSRDDYDEYLNIASLYIEAGRGNEAVEAANKALELAPEDQPELVAQALILLSSAQERAGDVKASEASLRRVLAKDPDNATALNNLGYFLVERNDRLQEALEMIQRAVRAEPGNASFLDSLGWAYFKLGQLEEAERYLSDAARRNPSSVTIQEHLGDLYQRRGKMDLARDAWRKALSLSVEQSETARIRAKLNGEPQK